MPSKIIHAEPTKDLFISMLIRDVPLNRAILDLVDNSIDGAIRQRGDDRFDELKVEITIKQDTFEIIDNCGGIDLEIAMDYAFRFGRPADAEKLDNAIGRFGIGMKRSLFKIGKHFRVTSYTKDIDFYVDVDVEEWTNKKQTIDISGETLEVDDWNFEFEEITEDRLKIEDGTHIEVKEIRENIASEFNDPYFIGELIKEIALAHSYTLDKGLSIRLNGALVEPLSFFLKSNDSLKPIYKTFSYKEDNWEDEVIIKIYAGIADRDLNKGGWYIFCNNRLVSGAENSGITGWQDKEASVPKYHPDYAYFRGYIFFESKDGGLLPWTTTKTGLNTDSLVYRKAYFEMTLAMQQIISVLKDRKNEKARYEKGLLATTPLHDLIEKTELINIYNIKEERNNFKITTKAPEIAEPEEPYVRIQYSKKESEVLLLKENLGVVTNKDVGSNTFDYYLSLVEK